MKKVLCEGYNKCGSDESTCPHSIPHTHNNFTIISSCDINCQVGVPCRCSQDFYIKEQRKQKILKINETTM